jgi:hypothetical protein
MNASALAACPGLLTGSAILSHRPQEHPNIRCSSAADKKPNILVIGGDDIGIHNISAYSRGMMGYRTTRLPPRRSRVLISQAVGKVGRTRGVAAPMRCLDTSANSAKSYGSLVALRLQM